MLPFRINPKETTRAREDYGSKGRTKQTARNWGNLKILMSWRVSDQDKTGGAMPRSRVEGGEREQRGVSSKRSVLLLLLL